MQESKGIDHIGVCVGFFCHDGNGKFLLSKRSQHTRDEQGRWDPGGGALELHETIQDAIRREIQEEYCTDVLSSEFLGIRDVHREHNDQKTHWVALDYKVLIDPSKVQNGEPHKADDVAWFTL